MNQRVGNMPRDTDVDGTWEVTVAHAVEGYQNFGTDFDNFNLVTSNTAAGQLRVRFLNAC